MIIFFEKTTTGSSMNPWLQILITAALAWVLGLATEFYRSRKAKELEGTKLNLKLDVQLRELLNIERIKVVSEFVTKVEVLREGLHTGYAGGLIIAWGKPSQDVWEPEPAVIQRASENIALIFEIDKFVNQNGLLLGKHLVEYWVKYQRALNALSVRLYTRDGEPYVGYSLGELTTLMYDDLVACLENTIGLPANFLAKAEERSKASTEGNELAKKLFADNVAKYNQDPSNS